MPRYKQKLLIDLIIYFILSIGSIIILVAEVSIWSNFLSPSPNNPNQLYVFDYIQNASGRHLRIFPLLFIGIVLAPILAVVYPRKIVKTLKKLRGKK